MVPERLVHVAMEERDALVDVRRIAARILVDPDVVHLLKRVENAGKGEAVDAPLLRGNDLERAHVLDDVDPFYVGRDGCGHPRQPRRAELSGDQAASLIHGLQTRVDVLGAKADHS